MATRPRTHRRAATVLVCLLALVVRLVLPALHTHGHPHPHGASRGTAVATVCSCGHHHALPGGGRSDERAVESPADRAGVIPCLACEIEWSTPGAPPPLPPLLGAPAAIAGAVGGTANDVRAGQRASAPPSRAPPAPRVRLVAERCRTA